ncbi:MAG: alpha/beta fold hydrolase [Kovacikia sp.]
MKQFNLAISGLMVSTLIALGVAGEASASRKSVQEWLPNMHADARQPKATQDLKATASQVVDLLAKGKFAEVTQKFDPTMQKGLSTEKLKQIWQAVVAEAGPFKRQISSRTEKVQQYDVVSVTCEFAKAKLDVQLTFDRAQKIAGLHLLPSNQAAKDTYQPPAYVKRDTFEEQAVTIGSGASAVSGVLTLPKGEGPFPAVVLVQGSGPHDRDETIGPNKPFRDLAWGLSSQNIAVLRYDKRTLVHPEQFSGSFTVKEEVTDDAIAAIALLRQTKSINPKQIFVLGHSLGGMLAPRIAQQDPALAGLIILAGNTRPFEDLFVAQSIYLASLRDKMTSREKQTIAVFKQQAERIKSRDLAKAKPTEIILGAPPAYWLDLRSYNQREVAKQLNQPLFVLQGERDYQVTLEDFRGWQKALSDRKNVTLKTYPALNHLFMSGEGKSNPAEYQTPNHIDETIVNDIANWVKQQSGPSSQVKGGG